MARVAVPAAVPSMFTGLVEPKLNVGRFVAPAGLDAIVADRTTLPVNPPEGVIVMVDVLPVVAPGAIVTADPVMTNPWVPLLLVTITEEEPLAPP